MMLNAFARNADGSLKHKQPCQTPGCNWPNWHICLDTSDPEYKKVHPVKVSRGRMSAEQKAKIAEAQRQRHAARRALTKERDDLIIKHYVEGDLGMSKIAEVLNVAQSTVNKVLNRAQREGVLKIRPKHTTIYRPGN